MTYWNLLLHYGIDAFARDLAAAGGLGMITPTSYRTRPTTGWQPRSTMTWTESFW